MASQLIRETKTWRVDNEDEATEFIVEAKDEAMKNGYLVTKSGYKIKTKKSKGQIIDSWAIVDITYDYE